MDWKLEVVVIPVTDVDRAKEFYTGNWWSRTSRRPARNWPGAASR